MGKDGEQGAPEATFHTLHFQQQSYPKILCSTDMFFEHLNHYHRLDL
jgi:hypothetical protein